jgi:hypothetical protein
MIIDQVMWRTVKMAIQCQSSSQEFLFMHSRNLKRTIHSIHILQDDSSYVVYIIVIPFVEFGSVPTLLFLSLI